MSRDAYEMRERHRQILTRQRPYILHNMCVTEQLWATMLANTLLSPEMVEECKTGLTSAEKVGKLLDMVPQRGPDAFDLFCEALLACDHAHVGEYLKTLEASENFAAEIRPHCVDISDTLAEKFVRIFQRSTPSMKSFTERKFQIIMEEQDRDLTAREDEIRELEGERTMLQLEVTHLRSQLNSCYETSDSVVEELSGKQLSKAFVREEIQHLNNLQKQLKDIKEFDKIRSFYSNMITIINFLSKALETPTTLPEPIETKPIQSNRPRGLQDRLQMLIEQLQNSAARFGAKAHVPGVMVKAELESVLRSYRDVITDINELRDACRSTMRQKRHMEGEVLSMLHDFQEIRRLDREMKEKQGHINELKSQSQFMRKKTINQQHRRQLKQIDQSLEEKRHQARQLQHNLDDHISSADKRLQKLLNLLPDPEEEVNCAHEFLRADTETTEASELESHAPGSRLATPSHGGGGGRDKKNGRPTSAIFNKNTYKKLAETLGARDVSHLRDKHNDCSTESAESNTESEIGEIVNKQPHENHNSKHKSNVNAKQNDTKTDTIIKDTPDGKTGAYKLTSSNTRTNPHVTSYKSRIRDNSPSPERAKPDPPNVTSYKSRIRDNSPSPERAKPDPPKTQRANDVSISSDVEKLLAQEQKNDRKRVAARESLPLAKPTMIDSEKSQVRDPRTMFPIAECNSERDKTTANSIHPPLTQRQTVLYSANPRRSVDMGAKLGTKEHYKQAKQRQTSSDLDHEKGYLEINNSSPSSGASRSDVNETGSSQILRQSDNKISRQSEATNSRTNFDTVLRSSEQFISPSRDNFQTDWEQEGPLTARKRKQSLLSPTDHNANVQFVQEETRELLHTSKSHRSSKGATSLKEDANKLKQLPSSNSREVLKANRIDLFI